MSIAGLEGLDDRDLVAAIGRHHQPALAEAYRRHGGAVWGLAKRVCRDAHLAEDVCQTVFVDLWARSERFDPTRGPLRSWLITQGHARAVDLVRSEEARRRREENEARARPAATDLGSLLDTEELAAGVRQAVDALPTAEREPILLAYFDGKTYREAAAMLGQPEGTVKSRIRAGLARLRLTLDAEGVSA